MKLFPKSRIMVGKFWAMSILILNWLIIGGCGIQPRPYSEGQHLTLAMADQRAMLEGVPGLSDGRLSLEEAILRALVFNLDHRLALSENIVADKERVLAAVSILPDLSANANFYDRSNENASSSLSYRTRNQSLEPSFSNKPGRQWGNLEFSWSILDCGLSYYHALQQADRVLITLERRRRTMNTIVKDVISTYYRALTAQRYLGRVNGLLAEADRALTMSRNLEKEKAAPLAEVLDDQKQLVTTIAQLKRIQSDLKQSQVQLAALCNLPLNQKFTLTSKQMPLPAMKQPVDTMETLGLLRRPELREERYQERIDIAAVKQEIIKMFPGIKILASFNWDTNPYLVHQHWSEAGVQVSASLLKMAGTGPTGKKAAEARQQMSQMRRLALSMATLVQINLSRHQYMVSLEEMKSFSSLKGIENRLLEQIKTEAENEAGGELNVIIQRTMTFASELAYDMSRVDAYTALGNLYFSMGVGMADLLPAEATIDKLGQAVHAGLDMMAKGELPPLPVREPVDDLVSPKVFNDNSNAAERKAAIDRNIQQKTI